MALNILTDSEIEEKCSTSNNPIQSITMLITEQCNLRCDYCYIYKAAKKMSTELARQSVDFLFRNSNPEEKKLGICFFGGEPLLEPKLLSDTADYAINLAKEHDRQLYLSMTSNATLLNNKNLELIEKYKISSTFSLDGIHSAHDRNRKTISGKGSFELIEKNLDNLLSIERCTIRLTVSPETAKELDESIKWLYEKGFKRLMYSPVYEGDWNEKNISEYFDALDRLYEYQIKIRESGDTDFIVKTIDGIDKHLTQANISEFGCGAARRMVAIDSQGYLYPCHRFVGYFKNGEFQRIGHVSEGFYTERREYYIRSNHISSRQGCGKGLFAKEIIEQDYNCGSCSLAGGCGSSCMAVSEHMTGSARDPHSINRVLSQVHAAIHLKYRNRLFSSIDQSGDTVHECSNP